MELSKTEKVIFDLLKARGSPVSIDDLGVAIYDERKIERPKNWRKSVSAMMRFLIAKTCAGPDKVVKTSAIGRGVKGHYSVKRGRK